MKENNRKNEIAKGIVEMVLAIIMLTASLILWSNIQAEAVIIGLVAILIVFVITFLMVYLGMSRIIKWQRTKK